MIMGAQFKKMGMNPETGDSTSISIPVLKKTGKAIGAFETVEFQFSLFESLSDENEDALHPLFLKGTKPGHGDDERHHLSVAQR